MRIAFGTVIYEQAWEWWKEFVESLNAQTTQEFEVLILNDGVSKEQVSLLKEVLNYDTYIYDVEKQASISEIRIQLLRIAKRMGYDLLVIGDFDDIFAKNRVESIIKRWDEDITFYYHNLQYENSDELVFEELPECLETIEEVLESNFLGLSNTAINLTLINEVFINSLENIKTNIFDWYLYSKILIAGGRGCVVENTYTIYRQQENNLAGLHVSDSKAVCKEIMIKKEHYKMLKNEFKIAEDLLKKYEELEKYNGEHLIPYKNNEAKRYWWSNIKILQ